MSVGVVVVAYRSAEIIEACLDSLLLDPDVFVVVVDNASDPDTQIACESVAGYANGRVTYRASENVGFARACNDGALFLLSRYVDQDIAYLAIVNPDVVLNIRMSRAVMDVDWDRCAIAAGILLSPHGSLNARPMVSVSREVVKAVLGSRAYRYQRSALKNHDSMSVGQLDGALLLMRRPTWQELGGFDEQFELYYEDVDICRRSTALGGCRLVNQVWGYHAGGASFEASGGRAFVALRVSRVRYLVKWLSPQWFAKSAAIMVMMLEYLARAMSRQHEGGKLRREALRRALHELGSPGSVRVLES